MDEAPRSFRQSAHEGGKVVSPTRRPPLPSVGDSWYSFMLEAAGRIKSTKNLKDPIENPSFDFLACRIVSQLTALRRTPL